MASYSAKGIFGRKGAGKTHELVRLALEKLREGRRVCIVVPQLNQDKVIRLFDDPTIFERLTVASYEDVAKPGFWPDEQLQTRLNTWRRFDMDYRREKPSEKTPRSEIPADAHKWKDTVVRPGDFVVLDEAWRWLQTPKDCPPGLKSALHMCRHWRGPADWRNPEDIDRYLSDDWFPGLGGAEYDKNGDYLGGDGTQMVTTNLVIASQKYQGLNRALREMLEESTMLIHVDTSALPEKYRKRFEEDREMYAAYTFESEHVPTWQQLDRAAERKEPIWVGEQFIYHEDHIHDLYSYADGYAREDRADDKNDISNHPNIVKLRKMLKLLKWFGVVAVLLTIAGLYTFWSRGYFSSSDAQILEASQISSVGASSQSQSKSDQFRNSNLVIGEKTHVGQVGKIPALAGYSRFSDRNSGPFDGVSGSGGSGEGGDRQGSGQPGGEQPALPNPFGTTRHVPNSSGGSVR